MINLDTIEKMWEKDSVIDPINLDTTSLDTSALHAKYLKIFNITRMLLKRRELRLVQLKKDKWLYFSGKMTRDKMDELNWPYDPFNGCSKPMKSELTNHIDADTEVQDVLLKIEYAKLMVESVEEIMNSIRWRHSAIKNAIEWKKFNAGI